MSVEVKEDLDKEDPEAEAMTDTTKEDTRNNFAYFNSLVAQDQVVIAEPTIEAEADHLKEEMIGMTDPET